MTQYNAQIKDINHLVLLQLKAVIVYIRKQCVMKRGSLSIAMDQARLTEGADVTTLKAMHMLHQEMTNVLVIQQLKTAHVTLKSA